jgi:cellulose synthase/poly-beta-1,6-N-acetylglucosamine synthase-like glycosyltransferase
VAGNLKVREPFRNPLVSCQAIEYLKTITIGRRGKSNLRILRIVSGAFGAFRREMIEEAGGWDIGPGLDGDITVKAIKGGWGVVFAPDAVCLTNTPSSLMGLINQRLRWNRSLIRFRVRKHSNVFVPNANFSFKLFISHSENLFFNVFLSFNWLFYLISLVFIYPDLFRSILLMNFLLYFFMNILQMLIALVLSERKKEDAKLLLYTPLMFFYIGYLLRPIRIISYIEEAFFKRSYSDKWNPAKVSRIAKKEGL